MGLGGALFEAIDFADGKILNPRFSSYRVPRFSDVPAIETVLLDRKDLPSAGAGETPIVGHRPGDRQRDLRRHRPAPARRCRCGWRSPGVNRRARRRPGRTPPPRGG